MLPTCLKLLIVLLLEQDCFIFKVEGTGVLPCATIVSMAIDILRAKLQLLHTEVQSQEEHAPMLSDNQQ